MTTDFFENNGHVDLWMQMQLCRWSRCCLVLIQQGKRINHSSPSLHQASPTTSTREVRKEVSPTAHPVVSGEHDDENAENGYGNWKKAGIGIDIVIALFMAGMEVLVIRGYKKRKNAE